MKLKDVLFEAGARSDDARGSDIVRQMAKAGDARAKEIMADRFAPFAARISAGCSAGCLTDEHLSTSIIGGRLQPCALAR